MTTADTIIAYVFLLLMLPSIISGVINQLQFRSFYILYRSPRSDPFIQKRKPELIIIYCIIAGISSLLTLPYICFAHILCTQHDMNKTSSIEWMNMSEDHRMNIIQSKWVFEFIHEVSTCFLLMIIAIRSWCLYYDYKCAIAEVHKVWRSLITATDISKWLQYKKYLGNYKFLSKVVSITAITILLLFVVLHLATGLGLYGFMADFTVAIPISIFILWLYYHVRDTRDQFRIKDELYRLSICVSIVGFSFMIWIFKEGIFDRFGLYNEDTVDIHLLMYTIDIIFTYFTVYFQTAWVIQHCVTTKKRKLNPDHGRFSNSIHSRSHSKITMVEILRSKEGFEAFVNHCVQEVNVEGLLFLVEVCQWKERVKRNGDSGEEKIETHNIDVAKENMHRFLLEARQDDDLDIIDPCDMRNVSYARASSLKKRFSAMVHGINAMKSNSSTGNRSIGVHSNFSCVSTAPSSNGSPIPVLHQQQLLQQLPLQLHDHSSGSVALPKGKTTLRTNRSNTQHEENFNNFQSGILDREWLPLSTALKSGTDIHNNGDISSDVDKEDKDYVTDSHEQKYNAIIQTLTQPNTADEAEEAEDADEAEEEIGITIMQTLTNTNTTHTTTEQVHASDIGNQTDTQILPEDEEIDMKVPDHCHMITPPPSNHGTPISTNIPHERTMKFSQLKHNALSIGEAHPHSNHIPSNHHNNHIIRQVHLKKGSSAPVTPIKSTGKKPNTISMGFNSNSSRAPAISLPSFIGSEAKMDDDHFSSMEERSPKRLKKTDTFRNSFKLMIGNGNMTKAKSNSSTNGVPSPLNPYKDNSIDLFKRAQYLYGKYIPTACDLAVNVSFPVREDLNQLFKTLPQDAIENIYEMNLDELGEEEKAIIDNDEHHRIRLIKTYLYHVFDQAFNEIWTLIRDDSFLRFQSTRPYQELLEANHNTPRDSLKKFGLPTKSRTGSPQNSPNRNVIPPPITMDNTPSLGTTIQMQTPPPLSQPQMHTNFSGSANGIPPETIPIEELKMMRMMKFEGDSDDDDDDNLVILEEEDGEEVDNVNNVRLQIQISLSHNDATKWKE